MAGATRGAGRVTWSGSSRSREWCMEIPAIAILRGACWRCRPGAHLCRGGVAIAGAWTA